MFSAECTPPATAECPTAQLERERRCGLDFTRRHQQRLPVLLLRPGAGHPLRRRRLLGPSPPGDGRDEGVGGRGAPLALNCKVGLWAAGGCGMRGPMSVEGSPDAVHYARPREAVHVSTEAGADRGAALQRPPPQQPCPTISTA